MRIDGLCACGGRSTLDRMISRAIPARVRRHSSLAEAIWVQAREKNDFPLFAPYLRETVQLSCEWAEAAGYDQHAYDGLLDRYEPGMKTAQVQEIFGELRDALVPLVA